MHARRCDLTRISRRVDIVKVARRTVAELFAQQTMNRPAPLAALLEQINEGRAADALPELDVLLRREPGHPGALALKAEALRLTGRVPEAIRAFKHAGERGAGARNWLAAGILLAAERSIDEALECLHRALKETPDSDEVLDALITTLFNANRAAEGIEFARRQLTLSANPTLLSRAALLLQGNDLYEESSNAFKRILELAPGDPALVGAALVPARFTCEWDWVDTLLRKIRTYYDEGRFAAAQEYPLTHVAWCADEARNLEVTRAYIARMVPRADCRLTHAPRPARSRIRVGYLSCDFRNHATMHLMAGVFESHDRARFEIFAYDYSGPDVSTYRQRFLDAVEHHVPIHSLSDRQAAARIGEDGLDILFDLKLYTGGGRAGILGYRPAPLQAAYLGFPGSAASADIDYVVSDRFVTPDESAPYYTEKFCRLPHTYQCNDRKRAGAGGSGTRAAHGLPDDKIVFGAFNQSYKVDRASFSHWLRVLKEVPNSVLWLLGQSEAAIANLTRCAESAGIARGRLIFAPFCQPQEHLARLGLADAVLDTLIYNGHTTTSDALWAGVPVITARGRHFASRVSESLLNAMELPELVGADPDDMVRIAKRIGTDGRYRAALRAKVEANRLTTPLFDTLRFTRNLERAIELMTERQRSGLPQEQIDVPDCGPVQPRAETQAAPAPFAAADPTATAAMTNAAPSRAASLQAAYPACPLCDGPSATLGIADSKVHSLWHEALPPTIEWMQCPSCGHIHSRHYWTEGGLSQIGRKTSRDPRADFPAILVSTTATWTPVVERVVGLLGGYRAAFRRESAPAWVDVGCGDGTLVMTAADYGFAAVGVDLRSDVVSRIRSLGFNAVSQEFMKLSFEIVPTVLSMMDVLAQIPRPVEALRKAAQVLPPGGVLAISAADFGSSSWRALEAAKINPYWMELEQHHIFSRERLMKLLEKCGFEIVDLRIPSQGKARMELYAVRK
jgi:protein O-GlcNAc transferase